MFSLSPHEEKGTFSLTKDDHVDFFWAVDALNYGHLDVSGTAGSGDEVQVTTHLATSLMIL